MLYTHVWTYTINICLTDYLKTRGRYAEDMNNSKNIAEKQEPLKFRIAPHIVEDLGLNLYTNISKVLVEYIANAYDADAAEVNIKMDIPEIDKARKDIKSTFEYEKSKNIKNPKLRF